MDTSEALRFADWFATKVQHRALDARNGGVSVYEGVRQAAKNLRKQGVPIEHALAMLRRPIA